MVNTYHYISQHIRIYNFGHIYKCIQQHEHNKLMHKIIGQYVMTSHLGVRKTKANPTHYPKWIPLFTPNGVTELMIDPQGRISDVGSFYRLKNNRPW